MKKILLAIFVLTSGLLMADTLPKKMIKHHVEFLVEASVEQCWDAWTQKEMLNKWLGTATEVDLKEGGDLSVSSALPYLSGRHRLEKFEPKKSLTYTWYVEGAPTKLDLTFAKQDKKTKVTLVHSVPDKEGPKEVYVLRKPKRTFYILAQSWDVAIPRYRALLEGLETGVVIPPFVSDHAIKLHVDIKATPEVIFKALTDASVLKKWEVGLCMENTEVEAKVGGVYSWGWYPKNTPLKEIKDGPTKILKLEVNKLLVCNWHGATDSEVEWKLEAKENGVTRVLFKHSPMPSYPTEEIWSYRLGWSAHLDNLQRFAENGEILTDWLKSVK